MRAAWRVVLVLALLLSWLRPAEGLAESAVERAKALTQKASAAYQVGHFDKALKYYEQAYELHAAPALIFNIAQCHRQLRRYDRALFLYKSYLRAVPDAINRAQVEAIIRDLEKLAEVQARAGAAPPEGNLGITGQAAPQAATRAPAVTVRRSAATDEEPAPRPWYKRWYVWAAIGAVVVGGVVGGVVAGTRGGQVEPVPQGDFGNMRFFGLRWGRP